MSQIDPGDNFFGVSLKDCVTVPNAGIVFIQTGDPDRLAAWDIEGASTLPVTESVADLRAANAALTRQLAAQALAHAEQMEEVRKDWAWSNSEWLETVQMQDARIAELKSELAAMRIATTKPTDAQQTAADVKPVPEPKAFPAGALKPNGGDRRRIGG